MSSDDHTVGYKKPPVAMRFQKGVSGNPKGRPKGKSIAEIIKAELSRNVRINEGVITKSMPITQVMIRTAINAAIKGDVKQSRLVWDLMKSLPQPMDQNGDSVAEALRDLANKLPG